MPWRTFLGETLTLTLPNRTEQKENLIAKPSCDKETAGPNKDNLIAKLRSNKNKEIARPNRIAICFHNLVEITSSCSMI